MLYCDVALVDVVLLGHHTSGFHSAALEDVSLLGCLEDVSLLGCLEDVTLLGFGTCVCRLSRMSH